MRNPSIPIRTRSRSTPSRQTPWREMPPATHRLMVRVEAAGRLRSRPHEYYAEDGKHDPLIIDVPKGGYRATVRSVRSPRRPWTGRDLLRPSIRRTGSPRVAGREADGSRRLYPFPYSWSGDRPVQGDSATEGYVAEGQTGIWWLTRGSAMRSMDPSYRVYADDIK